MRFICWQVRDPQWFVGGYLMFSSSTMSSVLSQKAPYPLPISCFLLFFPFKCQLFSAPLSYDFLPFLVGSSTQETYGPVVRYWPLAQAHLCGVDYKNVGVPHFCLYPFSHTISSFHRSSSPYILSFPCYFFPFYSPVNFLFVSHFELYWLTSILPIFKLGTQVSSNHYFLLCFIFITILRISLGREGIIFPKSKLSSKAEWWFEPESSISSCETQLW